MRAFLVTLLLLLFVTFGYAQSYKLWVEDFTATAAGTDYSEDWNFADEYRDIGKFDGLVCVTLDLDSSTTVNGDDDSLYFFPEYKVNGEWFRGDTIAWDSLSTSKIDSAFYNVDVKAVVVPDVHNNILIWQNDPTSTTSIEGLPVWTDFRLAKTYNDSVTYTIDARAGRY